MKKNICPECKKIVTISWESIPLHTGMWYRCDDCGNTWYRDSTRTTIKKWFWRIAYFSAIVGVLAVTFFMTGCADGKQQSAWKSAYIAETKTDQKIIEYKMSLEETKRTRIKADAVVKKAELKNSKGQVDPFGNAVYQDPATAAMSAMIKANSETMAAVINALKPDTLSAIINRPKPVQPKSEIVQVVQEAKSFAPWIFGAVMGVVNGDVAKAGIEAASSGTQYFVGGDMANSGNTVGRDYVHVDYKSTEITETTEVSEPAE